jgi:hypothetical protein
MVCSLLPAAAMSMNRVSLVVLISLLVVAFSFGWPYFADIRFPWSAGGVLLAVGAAEILIVTLSPSQADVGLIIAVVALSVAAIFVREAVHHVPGKAFIDGAIAMSVGVVSVSGLVAWLGVTGSVAPVPLAWLASAVAFCVCAVAWTLPLGSGEDLVARTSVGIVGILAGAVAAFVGVRVAHWGSSVQGLVVGICVGLVVSVVFWAVRPHVVLRVAAPIDRGDFALAILPVLAVGLPLWGACLALS